MINIPLLIISAPQRAGRAAVRADVDTYGCNQGGLILRGEVAGDVPLENVEAMLDEMTHYRIAKESP